MKKIIIGMLFTIAMAAFVSTASAQVKVNVNINIGDQPEWGPAGYDYAEYYYMPDIETYYYVPGHQFVYFSGNRWIFSSNLPPAHAHYNLYSGYKVVFKSPHAYKHFNDHKVKYVRYKNHGNKEKSIKYKKDNGNHYGHDKNKGKGKSKGHGKKHG